MAINKAQADLIGTSAALQAFAAAQAISSGNRDVSGKVGVMLTVRVSYGASTPTTDPELRVYTSPDGVNFDTIPYRSIFIPRTKEDGSSAASSVLQISAPLDFAEDVKHYNAKLINGATNGISVWVSAVEVSL